MDEAIEITLRVNGTPRTFSAPPRRLLHDALRHDLRLTGTHVGCEHGVCGCCTVLLDGDPVRSCLMLAVSARGSEITTVEGLSAADGGLHPVQQAFQECHGLQCGFCTPGFLMSTCGLLAENPDPTDDEIVEGISGNLCRCTGYQNIVASVRRAAALQRGEQPPPTGWEAPPGDGAATTPGGPAAVTATDEPDVHPAPTAGQPVPYGATAAGTPGTATADDAGVSADDIGGRDGDGGSTDRHDDGAQP